MAVSIPSDLVADVMRVADPQRLKAVTTKLHGTTGAEFAETLERAESPRTQSIERSFPTDGSEVAVGKTETAYRSFEQMVLRSLFESMLPAAESGVYGHDVSAGVWRSLSADQLAHTFAESGGLGFASMLPGNTNTATASLVRVEGQWPYFQTAGIQGFAG